MRVEHQSSSKRFVVRLPEGEAELRYARPDEHTIDLQHTHVPEAARGHGIGEALVAAAMSHARSTGAHVIPTCPFVQHWIASHPGEADLAIA